MAPPIQFAGVRDPITSVTGSDSGKTVTVAFRETYRPWQASFGQLLPAHIGRRVGWNTGFDRFDPDVVISGGPFRIAAHNPGSDLTLVPNEHYWANRPMLDRIVLRYIGRRAPPTRWGIGRPTSSMCSVPIPTWWASWTHYRE